MSKLAPGHETDLQTAVVDSIPIGRMGSKADIALACVYLASSAATFVTGEGRRAGVSGVGWSGLGPAPISTQALALGPKLLTLRPGHVLVVDGGNWMWRPNVIPREMVTSASRGVESKSRQVGIGRSKL